MTDLRAQIEQLPRYSPASSYDWMADPDGDMVSLVDVLALLADHAAPVVAPSEAVCDICHERAACGCGNLRAFAAPVVAPPSEQQSAEGQCIPIAARYFPESEERYSRCLAALCEAFALGQKVAPVVGETPSKEG
jgi:hypothetical protein